MEHGSIYVLGGPSTAVVDRFDGKKWRRETILPGGKVNAPAAVSLAGKIYVIGGFSGSSNRPVSVVRVYDTASRRWSRAAPLPAPRGGQAAAVLDGKIHVVGGGNSESTIADHSVYDPATGSWSEAAPLPRSEGSPAAVVFHGRLYAIGGRSGTSDYGDVFVYDATSDTWSNGPSIPPRGTAGATVFHDAIYVFGGESQARFKTLRDVYRLTAGGDGLGESGPAAEGAELRARGRLQEHDLRSGRKPDSRRQSRRPRQPPRRPLHRLRFVTVRGCVSS